MATEIGTSPGGVILTQFFGGSERGICIQVGDDLQLDIDEAEWVATWLRLWAQAKRREDEQQKNPHWPAIVEVCQGIMACPDGSSRQLELMDDLRQLFAASKADDDGS